MRNKVQQKTLAAAVHTAGCIEMTLTADTYLNPIKQQQVQNLAGDLAKDSCGFLRGRS